MRILISSAADVIGSELVLRLAEAGHGIVALVHPTAERVIDGNQTVPTACWTGEAPYPGHVHWLPANLSRPRLDLGEDDAILLGAQTDLVIHVPAQPAFDASDDDLRQAIIDSTANLLALAPDAGFLHVSTAYVSGARNGPIPEAPCETSHGFCSPHEEAMARAEALIQAAAKAGRRTVIARPSVVVGADGRGVATFADPALHGLAHAPSWDSGDTVGPAGSIDFVPLDHVIGGLTDLVAHWPRAIGKVFHLASGAPVPVRDLQAARESDGQIHSPASTARNPLFLTDNLKVLSGRVCPPFTGAMNALW